LEPSQSRPTEAKIKIQYPNITFPPHWPQAIPSGHRNQKISNQMENDYSLAARNIYDVLDTLNQQKKSTRKEMMKTTGQQEHLVRGPTQHPHYPTQLQIPWQPAGHQAQK
jgi:hypothetical protein